VSIIKPAPKNREAGAGFTLLLLGYTTYTSISLYRLPAWYGAKVAIIFYKNKGPTRILEKIST
jgi:hypothetical protein